MAKDAPVDHVSLLADIFDMHQKDGPAPRLRIYQLQRHLYEGSAVAEFQMYQLSQATRWQAGKEQLTQIVKVLSALLNPQPSR